MNDTPGIETDWDDAYANAPHIPGAEGFIAKWPVLADDFRRPLVEAGRARLAVPYGTEPRQTLDLFLPEKEPEGLVIFVHGGFWKAFDPSVWSHLAAGPLARGHAVAMPSYTLAPDARLRAMTREVSAAVERAASLVDGPVRLVGHSAGGHLVTRLICDDSRLAPAVLSRIARVLSLSGLHDLRPLLKTEMNTILLLDPAEAAAESPALREPLPGIPLTCWVGADERPEFLRQNRLLPLVWHGFGMETATVEEPGRHHFDVVEGLTDPASPLMDALFR